MRRSIPLLKSSPKRSLSILITTTTGEFKQKQNGCLLQNFGKHPWWKTNYLVQITVSRKLGTYQSLVGAFLFVFFGTGAGGIARDEPGTIGSYLFCTWNFAGLTPAADGILGVAPEDRSLLGGHILLRMGQNHFSEPPWARLLALCNLLYNICAHLSIFQW